MTDTGRTLSELKALLADNATAQISAQDIRDWLVSCFLNNITEVTSGAHEIGADDVFVHVEYTNTGAVAITWPTALLLDRKIVIIKDADGNASGNNITITPESGTIDGGANFVMNNDYSSYGIYCWGGNLFVF